MSALQTPGLLAALQVAQAAAWPLLTLRAAAALALTLGWRWRSR
jgi:hypothetical protein